MKKIAIITDSAGDLSASFAKKHNIKGLTTPNKRLILQVQIPQTLTQGCANAERQT